MGSLKYDIVITDGAETYYVSIYPLDNHYTIHTEFGDFKAMETQDFNQISNVGKETLTFSEPNMSYFTMGLDLQFQDGLTRQCQFYVKRVENHTEAYNNIIYSKTFNGVTTNRLLDNVTVENVRGQQFKWWWECGVT
jgi:hypothetical protein